MARKRIHFRESPATRDVDNRPRIVRHAEQCFREGYRLFVDERSRTARWRHLWRMELDQPYSTVAEIVRTFGKEYGHRIHVTKAPLPASAMPDNPIALVAEAHSKVRIPKP